MTHIKIKRDTSNWSVYEENSFQKVTYLSSTSIKIWNKPTIFSPI